MRAEIFSVLFIAVSSDSRTQSHQWLMLKMSEDCVNGGQTQCLCLPVSPSTHFGQNTLRSIAQDFSALYLELMLFYTLCL